MVTNYRLYENKVAIVSYMRNDKISNSIGVNLLYTLHNSLFYLMHDLETFLKYSLLNSNKQEKKKKEVVFLNYSCEFHLTELVKSLMIV